MNGSCQMMCCCPANTSPANNNNCCCCCNDGFNCGCAGELVNAIIGLTVIQSILALIFGGICGYNPPA